MGFGKHVMTARRNVNAINTLRARTTTKPSDAGVNTRDDNERTERPTKQTRIEPERGKDRKQHAERERDHYAVRKPHSDRRTDGRNFEEKRRCV